MHSPIAPDLRTERSVQEVLEALACRFKGHQAVVIYPDGTLRWLEEVMSEPS